MVAPRGFLVLDKTASSAGQWLNIPSSHIAAIAGAEVYKALGVGGNLHYINTPTQSHCQWNSSVYDAPVKDFIDKFLHKTKPADGTAPLFTATAAPSTTSWIDWTTPTLTGSLPPAGGGSSSATAASSSSSIATASSSSIAASSSSRASSSSVAAASSSSRAGSSSSAATASSSSANNELSSDSSAEQSSSSDAISPISPPYGHPSTRGEFSATYFNLKGEPLGAAKPKEPGVYIEKSVYGARKIVVK
jgi:hypothetical protein